MGDPSLGYTLNRTLPPALPDQEVGGEIDEHRVYFRSRIRKYRYCTVLPVLWTGFMPAVRIGVGCLEGGKSGYVCRALCDW
jgi:hypothetical protein